MQKTKVWSLCQEDPVEKEWQPAPVFLPGEFHGERSLEGYSPWGHERVRHDWETNTLTTYADLGSTKGSTRFDKRAFKILKETILQRYKEQKESEVK